MWNNKIRYLDHVFGEEDDIKKGNCYLVGTLLGDSLSINTLEFDVESDDSTLTQFKRNDPVIYEHNGKQIGILIRWQKGTVLTPGTTITIGE